MKPDIKWIRAGWLIDGSGGPVQKNMCLQIKDGLLAELRPDDAGGAIVYGQLDLTGYTVLPCLIDCHVHLFMSGTGDLAVRERQLKAPFEDAKVVINKHLKHHLACGVLCLRDGGDSSAHALCYKDRCPGETPAPMVLKVAGRAWHQPGRYGGLIGRPLQNGESLAGGIAKETGDIDHVKIVNSGLNSLTEFGRQTQPQFDVAALKKAVAAARSRGFRVMVHANGLLPVKAALEAGCDSIEHGFFMGTENLRRMADKQITWVPTAFTMKAYADHMTAGSAESDVSRKNLDHQLEQISQARHMGVRIALGTDAGSLGVHHGSGVIEEMKMLMEAGFSLAQAVECAGANGAMLLGTQQAGRLHAGRPARFIAVKGGPAALPNGLVDCRVYDQTGWLTVGI